MNRDRVVTANTGLAGWAVGGPCAAGAGWAERRPQSDARPPKPRPLLDAFISGPGLARNWACVALAAAWLLIMQSVHAASQADLPRPITAASQRPLAPDSVDWDQEILALDESGRNGRGMPAQRLADVLTRMPAQHPLRWKALALRAFWLSDAQQAAGLPEIVAELQALQVHQPEVAAAVPLAQAWVARVSGQPRLAESLTEAGMAQLTPASPPLLQFMLQGLAATIKDNRGQHDEAVALRRQQLVVAKTLGPRREASSMIGLIYSLSLAGQVQAAQHLIEQLIRLAGPLQDHYALAQAYRAKCFLDGEIRHVDPTLSDTQAAVQHARLSGHVPTLAINLGNLADYWLRAGRFNEALQVSKEALALPGQQDTDLLLVNQGLALIGLKRLDEGMQSVQAGMARARADNDRVMLAVFGRDLADALERSGYLREAVKAHVDHRDLARDASQAQQRQAVTALQEASEAQQRSHALDLLQRENHIKQDMLDHEALITRAVATAVLMASSLLALALWLLHCLRRANTALQTTNERLRRQATEDILTGLPNRRQITERLADPQEAALLASAGLLLIDLDHFKRINDTLGHAVGDQVLVQAASRLRTALGPSDMLARWGGEEFLVVSQQASMASLHQLANRLLQALNHAPLSMQGRSQLVTASIGLARLPGHRSPSPLEFDDALQDADQALYQAKSAGRNQAAAGKSLNTSDANSDGDLSLPWPVQAA